VIGLLVVRVTTCLENLEISRNFAVVREMSANWPFVWGMSGKKFCQGKTTVFNEQTSVNWQYAVLLDINCVL